MHFLEPISQWEANVARMDHGDGDYFHIRIPIRLGTGSIVVWNGLVRMPFTRNGASRPVLRIDSDVFLGEVRGLEGIAALALAKGDVHMHLLAAEGRGQQVVPVHGHWSAEMENGLSGQGHADHVRVEVRPAAAQGGHDPAPVGSWPYMAVLTSGEWPTARAASLA